MNSQNNPTDKLLEQIQQDRELISPQINPDASQASSFLEVNKLQKRANFLARFISKAKEQFNSDIKYLRDQKRMLTLQITAQLARSGQYQWQVNQLKKTVDDIKGQIERVKQELNKYRQEQISDIDAHVAKKASEVKLMEATANAKMESANALEKKLKQFEGQLLYDESDLKNFQKIIRQDYEETKKNNQFIKEEMGRINEIKSATEKEWNEAKRLRKLRQQSFDGAVRIENGIKEKSRKFEADKGRILAEIGNRERVVKQRGDEQKLKEKQLSDRERWLDDRESTLTRAFREFERKQKVV